jgi:hypothetical protein
MSSVQRLTAALGPVVEVGSGVAATTGTVVAADVDTTTVDPGEAVSDAQATKTDTARKTVHARRTDTGRPNIRVETNTESC